jgi:hypothetical protein
MNEINTGLNGMDDWVDFDVALFEVGRALGLFPMKYGDLPDAKALLWSKNTISSCLGVFVKKLVEIGYLEYNSESEQFRLKKGFVIGLDRPTGTAP